MSQVCGRVRTKVRVWLMVRVRIKFRCSINFEERVWVGMRDEIRVGVRTISGLVLGRCLSLEFGFGIHSKFMFRFECPLRFELSLNLGSGFASSEGLCLDLMLGLGEGLG